MLKRIQSILAHERFPLLAAALAFALLAPSLGAGLFADDQVHRLSLRPDVREATGIQSAMGGDWDLFTFHRRGTPQALMDRGIAPWWTDPAFRLAFLRPLSSLWHALDYRVWPEAPWLMHLESVALFAVGALLAAWLYRRLLLPPWAAGAAAFFFAVDDAHALVVSWIANRHALLSGAFVLAAVLVHVAAREDRARGARLLAPALFAAGLLAGESGLGALAYLFAYAVWLDRGPWAPRLVSLVPYAVITVAWAVAYRGLGFGAAGTGFYIDPGTDPLGYAAAVVHRMPLLLLIQFAGIPAWVFGFNATRASFATLVGVIAVLGLLGWALVLGVRRDRRAGFFATGMLLALLPVCAARPLERMLLLPSVGAFGLIAVFLAAPALAGPGVRGRLLRATAVALVVLHGVVAPVLLPARGVLFAGMARLYIERGTESLPRGGGDGQDTLVVLNAPDVLLVNYALTDRLLRGERVPAHVRLLAVPLHGDMTVTRLDARTISVTLPTGFIADAFSAFYRGPRRFTPGDTIAVAGMRAEIAETLPDGRPRRVIFRFDEPLESPRLSWVRWDRTRFVPAAPPAPGEILTVPPIDYLKSVRGID